LEEFTKKHGGVACALAVLPVRSSKAASNVSKVEPTTTKLMVPVLPPKSHAAKVELDDHYPGWFWIQGSQKESILRQ